MFIIDVNIEKSTLKVTSQCHPPSFFVAGGAPILPIPMNDGSMIQLFHLKYQLLPMLLVSVLLGPL
jgi:hypothetical protein